MKLDEVERLDLEIFEAAVDPAVQVLICVAGDGLLRQAAAGLGRDEHAGARPRLQGLGDQPFRAAVAIDVRGVDEGHASVERGVQRGERLAFLDLAPASADRPGAEADLADAAAGASENSLLHYGFTHFALAFDDLTAASMKARPLTPSSMVGNWTPLGGFLPDRAALIAAATSA